MKAVLLKSKKTMGFIIVAILFFAAWVLYGYLAVRNIEQPNYTVLDDSKEYEIRQYEGYIVAETDAKGNGFRSDGNEAFRVLANYIFGGNQSKEKISMTTPVIESSTEPNETGSEKISMTTPVILEQSPEGDGSKKYAFTMPSKYTLETLPEPLDDRVTLREVPPFKVAVLQFSGFFTDRKFEDKKKQLIEYLKRDGLKFTSIISAGYNPPFTPPFMNRLEVWAVLE